MLKIKLLIAIASLGTSLFWLSVRSSPNSISSAIPTVTPSPPKTIRYFERNLPQGIAHILVIPGNSRFVVTSAISQKVNTVEEFAQKRQAIAILNAGFFDPANQKSTSYVVVNGQLVANPKDNERLVNNPKLKPYLNLIFNRTEFRRYLCGQITRYAIALHNQSPPATCRIVDAIGAGPRLLPQLTSLSEGFVDNATGRDALGSKQPNARTAVGITRDGNIILVMVAQKPAKPNSGISLPQLADLMKTLGAEEAMNLDGGSSSSLYFKGKTFYGKVDLQGNPIKRPVKSVLLVQDN
ncbi:phosphodiester glycosidase family protein [Nostoc sp. FACHB-152]|uniref:phosphodiester glycosidase family protein n=1 Tax=unclassified Nostoc TaxID=2593658 RepID=UPI001685F654|nr:MULTISPECIES: phosphodiester glycosidase family protein [unclassified Nostoc]MBD2449930.1 phosphodiester glycosidase family protein [Nostoc sp. FACHB-152]MBD2471390.1 phosphodiester glycosidase family protein [Nostoc sp. FACHB-145]